jgi:PAS domain S-box-containing protein
MAGRERPDLVLMDLSMGEDMEGVRTAAAVRSNFGVPVVFTTADADMARIEMARSARPFGFIFKPYLDSGLKIAVETALYDIRAEEEREKNIREIRQERDKLKSLVESMPDEVWLCDSSGGLTPVNAAAIKGLGIEETRDTFLPLSEFVHGLEIYAPDGRPRAPEDAPLFRSLKGETIRELDESVRHPRTGEMHHRQVSSAPILSAPGQIAGAVAVVRDVTDRRRTEDEIRVNESRFRGVFETIENIPVQGYDKDRRVIFWNKASEKTYGFTAEEALGRKLEELIVPHHMRDEVASLVTQWVEKDVPIAASELVLLNKDGSGVPVFSSHVMIVNSRGEKEMYCIDVDLTERQKAEEALKLSEDKYRDLVENTEAFILKIDREGTILFLNGYAKEVFGFTDEESIGRNVAGIIVPENCAQGGDLKAILAAAAEHPDKYQIFESEVAARPGKKIRSRWRNRPTFGEDGSVKEWLCVGTDVTDRYLVESQLSATLQEKDVLLKEVHHRVKNNLQVLSSLLNLQVRKENDPKAMAVIREAQTRVTAMAQVHESLYASESVAAIDLQRYVGKLVNSLIDTYQVSRSRVRVGIDIRKGITVQIDKAVSCGLILNELISNSLKYAFPGDMTGEISISAAISDGRVQLDLKDNGVGLPDGLDWRNSGSLGLFLVNSLVEGQLGGSLRVSNRGGAEYLVDIPL